MRGKYVIHTNKWIIHIGLLLLSNQYYVETDTIDLNQNLKNLIGKRA